MQKNGFKKQLRQLGNGRTMKTLTQKEAEIIFDCLWAVLKAHENKECAFENFTIEELVAILNKIRGEG
jgi:hypothetical protein